MFEPLLASLTWVMQHESLSLGRISGAGWLAARSAPEVMRLCSNPVGHRPAPGRWGTRDREMQPAAGRSGPQSRLRRYDEFRVAGPVPEETFRRALGQETA